MPFRVSSLAPVAVAAGVVGAAVTSCSGKLAIGTTADAGPVADSGPGGPPPTSALREVSLQMTRVNFGDPPDAGAWRPIGFNVDGKTTTATSTDVCGLVQGAGPATREDGQDGIDNSFGANVCPILDDTMGPTACSSGIPETYLVTDASGSGVMTIQLRPTIWLELPITDAYVVVGDDGSGMLGAVAPIQGVLVAVDESAAQASCGSMSGGQPDSILQQLEQACDILADGSNAAGQPCDAISIGMQFWGASAFDGVLPAADACATD
ncbi:MAG TPA: hypothetical protein VGG39_02175 [Polyangiaceae bacterium]